MGLKSAATGSKIVVSAAIVAAFAAPACSKSVAGSGPTPRATATATGVSGSAVPSQASRAARPPAPQVVTVTVDAAGFRPRDVRLAPGTNVIWIQGDGGAHVVVSGGAGHEDGKFRSLAMKKGSSFTIVARDPGTYRYFDQLHPSLTAQFVVAGHP